MEIKIKEQLEITGRGTILLIDTEENGYDRPEDAFMDLRRGTEIKAQDKNYEIITVELQKNLMNGDVKKDMGLVVREINMTYVEKVEKYSSKNARIAFREKTPFEELPIKFGHGSSTHHPEAPRTGITTCDIKLWMKFLDNWFTPYGEFSQDQIEKMIEICNSDQQSNTMILFNSINHY